MSIKNRLDKLRFLIDEMKRSKLLADFAPDDFTARTMARHAIVRAENFIAHARNLRKPLAAQGFSVGSYHKKKEIYAKTFEEYYPLVRHKLAAHVQDLNETNIGIDFGLRIENWNSIEVVKLTYFVEGAEEIYKSLESLGIPDYIAYRDPLDLSDVSLLARLGMLKAAGSPAGAELGTDALAMSRSNAISMLPLVATHKRASQLTMIRRWVEIQTHYLKQLASFEGFAQLLKARLITDVISYCDCLITRPVPADALQKMDGLDTLLISAGSTVHALSSFVRVCKYDDALKHFRDVRNHIGGHLEDDENTPLADTLAELAAANLFEALRVFSDLHATFQATCRDVDYLRPHLADGHRIYGVIVSGADHVPFQRAGSQPPHGVLSMEPPSDDDEGYEAALAGWMSGDAKAREAARVKFHNAFMHSAKVETITEEIKKGAGSISFERRVIRNVHCFLLKKLLADDVGFAAPIMNLLVHCQTSDPQALALLVGKFAKAAAGKQLSLVCYAYGWLASWDQPGVREFLTVALESQEPDVLLQATLALFRMFVREEGSARISDRKFHQHKPLEGAIELALSKFSLDQRLFVQIALLSSFWPHLDIYLKPFKEDRERLIQEVYLQINALDPSLLVACQGLLGKLHEAGNYAWFSLIVGDHFSKAGKAGLAHHLYMGVASGTIYTQPHRQGLQARVKCLDRLELKIEALELAKVVARGNPHDFDSQVLVAEVLAEVIGSEGACIRILDGLEKRMNLEAKQQTHVRQLRTRAQRAIVYKPSSRMNWVKNAFRKVCSNLCSKLF